MSDVVIRLYRLIGYDKIGTAYDVTRTLNIDTEQFINFDLNLATVDEADITKTLNISKQDKKDIARIEKEEKEAIKEEKKAEKEAEKEEKKEKTTTSKLTKGDEVIDGVVIHE